MEFGFDNYSNDKAGNFYGYTDDAWFYQDPYFSPNQDMTQHMVQETQLDERGRRDEGGRMDERERRGERERMEDRGRRNPNNMSEMPLAPPPSQAPPHRMATFRVDANSIRHCIRRLTYIWQDNGMEYWMLPLNVSTTTVSGFRWNGRRWLFAGVSLRRIDSFTCI